MARFVRIAQGYDFMSVTLAVTALEGAGFTVMALGGQLNSVLPQMSVALGPMPILVPLEDAADARAFLAAIEDASIEILDPEHMPDDLLVPHDPVPADWSQGWWHRIWNAVFGWLTSQAASPPRGLYLDRRPPAEPRETKDRDREDDR